MGSSRRATNDPGLFTRTSRGKKGGKPVIVGEWEKGSKKSRYRVTNGDPTGAFLAVNDPIVERREQVQGSNVTWRCLLFGHSPKGREKTSLGLVGGGKKERKEGHDLKKKKKRS